MYIIGIPHALLHCRSHLSACNPCTSLLPLTCILKSMVMYICMLKEENVGIEVIGTLIEPLNVRLCLLFL